MGNGIMVESSKRLKPWRTDVREAVAAALPADWDMTLPVEISALFTFPRPKGHFNSKGELRPNAPVYYALSRNDCDKICRAILDAMTCVAYLDDGQVADLHAYRRYAPSRSKPGGALIQVRILDA